MKKIILMVILTGAVYSQCDESNWQDYYNSEDHIMVRCNLREADLSGAILSGANLSDSDLRNVNLTGAILSGANLSDSDLRYVNLTGANLTGADLSGANLRKANLRKANLRNANLTRAMLNKADLSGADLSGANLSGAILERTNLTGADLSGAILSGANLSDSDLRNVNLTGANLTGVVGDEIRGTPKSLPEGWSLADSILINDDLIGGKDEFEGSYKDGKPNNGLATGWHENGQKMYEGTLKDGKPDGKFTNWYDNGKKKSEVTFKDGELDGLMTEWNENGQKEIEGTFKDGNLITHPSPSYSSSSIVGYDWCTPNCNDPTSAFKFSSDGTFNFSTIMFGGMSRWGTWKDLGNNKIQTSDNQVGTQTITILSDTRIQVGSTVYVR